MAATGIPPTITSQPTSVLVTPGSVAYFTVAASGSPTPTVQWQVSDDGGMSFSPILGATSFSYTVPVALLASPSLQYQAVISNYVGLEFSDVATLVASSAAYQSNPVVGSQVVVFAPRGSSATGQILVTNSGSSPLVVTVAGALLQGSWISFPELPLSVAVGSSSNLFFECTSPLSPATPQWNETISLMTNDLTMVIVQYSIVCDSVGPVFSSTPAPGSLFDFGIVIGSNSVNLVISNLGLELLTSQPSALSSWFSLSIPVPISVLPGQSTTISITCQPPFAVIPPYSQMTTLSYTTNEAPTSVNSHSYHLTCSKPAPTLVVSPASGSTLSFSSVIQSLALTISISNNGAGPLSVSQSGSFAPGSWFSISSGSLPISNLNQGSPASIVSIVCTPPTGSSPSSPFLDTLVLSTNDPTQSSVIFSLSCTPYFVSNPPPGSLISILAPAYILSNQVVTITNLDGASILPIQAFLSAIPGDNSTTIPSNVFVLTPSGQSNISPASSLDLTVSCTPFNEMAQYQVTLVVIAGSSVTYSYPIVCNAQPFVSLDVGALSLGPLKGGELKYRLITLGNQVSMPVSLSLSGIIDGMISNGSIDPSGSNGSSDANHSNNSTSYRRSTLEALDNSWTLSSAVAIVSLTPGSITLAANGSILVTLSLIPLAPFSHTLVLQLETPFTLSPVSVAQLSWYCVAPLIEFESNDSNTTVIDIGSVPVGASKVGGGLLSNVGNAVLELNGLSIGSSSSTWLSVLSPVPNQLLPSELLAITVECAPASTGTFSTTAMLSSSSLVVPDLSISITCVGTASCDDGYRNQGEDGIDCGGPCEPCVVPPPPLPPPPSSTPPAVPLPSNSSSSSSPAATGVPPTPSASSGNSSNSNNNNGGNTQPLPPPVSQPHLTLEMSTLAPTITMQVIQPLSTNGSATTIVVTSPSGRSASVTVSSDTGEATALVVGPVSASVVQSATMVSNVRLGSLAIDVTLANGTSQLSSPAQLCFSTNERTSYRSACLGYIDSSGRWQCEDKCLSMSNSTQICGSTSHFTNFAVLLSGGGGRQCNPYITGSWQGDLGLAAAVFGFVWGLAFCACFAFLFDTPYRRWLRNDLRAPRRRRSIDSRTAELEVGMVNPDDYHS